MLRYSASTGGFYPYDIHYPNLPTDCVEITEDDHAALMAAQATGKVIVADADGLPVAVDPVVSVADARKQAIAAINQHAGYVRTLFVTDLPGQQMIYLAKEAEARAYLAESPEPASLAGYPMIAAEVGITADTALELALYWQGTANQWRALAASIEQIRLGHIKMLEHPDLTVDAAISMRDGAIAALDQIASYAP
jgi:hypothetical protein